jgi:hypothetical protein
MEPLPEKNTRRKRSPATRNGILQETTASAGELLKSLSTEKPFHYKKIIVINRQVNLTK